MRASGIQLVGLQRSGTTWLYNLLNRNFRTVIHLRGKHSTPSYFLDNRVSLRGVLVVVIEKQVDKWIESIGRGPTSFPSMYPDSQEPGGMERVHDEFYRSWDTVFSDPSVCPPNWTDDLRALAGYEHWNYADILADPAAFLSHLAKRYGLEPKLQEWDVATPRGSETTPWTDERRAYYLEDCHHGC